MKAPFDDKYHSAKVVEVVDTDVAVVFIGYETYGENWMKVDDLKIPVPVPLTSDS